MPGIFVSSPSHSEADKIADEMRRFIQPDLRLVSNNSCHTPTLSRYPFKENIGMYWDISKMIQGEEELSSPASTSSDTNDLTFARKAFMKFLVMYFRITKKGPINPDERDVTCREKVEGIDENVFTFEYLGTKDISLKADVVPNKGKNSAEVRINTEVERMLGVDYEGLFYRWFPITNVEQRY